MDEEEAGLSVDTAFELNDEPNKKLISAEKQRFMRGSEVKRSMYFKLSNQLEDKLNGIQQKVHFDFINEIVDFIDHYKAKLEDGDKFELSFVQTGIISISCSTTEYEFIFDLFINKLNESCLKNVIFVSASDKMTLEMIVDLIYKQTLTDELLNEVIRVKNEKKFLQTLKFKQFASIYQKHFANEPIILIIDDLISMNRETINHLFELLHNNLDKVPALVFCGLSQASVSLQSLIKPKVLNRLCISSFTTKDSFQILDEVFDSAFIETDLDLKFGSKCLTHFLNTFTYYDFSIKKIEHLAKLAIWDFCYSNEFAFLNGEEDRFVNKLNDLSKDELKRLMSMESMRDCEVDSDVKGQLVNYFKDMSSIEATFLGELRALYELIKTTTIVDSFRSLYLNFLSTDFNIKQDIEKLSRTLMDFQAEEWRERLESVISNDLINQTGLVKLLRQQFDKLGDVLKEKVVVEEKKDLFKNLNGRYAFKIQLAENAKKQEINSPFKQWKKDTINLIKEHLNELDNPSYFYLNELFYYDNSDLIKQFNLVSFREQTIKHLVSSDHFVKTLQKHSTKQKENDRLIAYKPEICFAFKLYRESQSKINLADWLQSYLVVLEQHELGKATYQANTKKSPRKKMKAEIDKNELTNQLTSNFFSNVFDLGYLGILESTGKSTDYATKLIV